MNIYKTQMKFALLAVLGMLLWAAPSALAQSAPDSVRVLLDCDNNVTLDWSSVDGVSEYSVSSIDPGSSGERRVGSTGDTSLSLGKLGSGSYTFYVDTDQGTWGTTTASLGRAKCPSYSSPPHFDCAEIANRVLINAIGDGTNCQSVVPGGIGDPSLIDAGVLDAIDIWGRPSNVRFCFHQHGRLKFVDTATMPRVTSNLAAETINGMTCGSVDRIGMVVLLRADEAASEANEASDSPAAAAETDPPSSTVCQLQTTGYLSLRAGPSVYFARLDVMPYGTRLLGMARDGDWFLVEYEGQRGWASRTYFAASPACDGLIGSSRVFMPRETEPAPVEVETQAETLESAQAETEEPGADGLVDCRLTAGDIINLRTSPGTEQNIEAEIPFRTQLIAIDRSGDWFKVEYDGIMGWVNIDYVFRRGGCG